ncbi:MAG: hypothetical protein IJY28_00025, partial [Clostridia bacterium]|nr:hypothetical protein [Clostridia bacterium]
MTQFPKTGTSLVPDTVNPSPDYYCTWQTQLFASCESRRVPQRDLINEECLFGDEWPLGWTNFYPDARKDLILVMDDSWDIPVGEQQAHAKRMHFGSLMLDAGKFPSFAGKTVENTDAMRKLAEAVKSRGWKGLGGWICIEQARCFGPTDPVEYWTQRTKEADAAGWAYWKVDWGRHSTDAPYRRMMTALAEQFAPALTVEHALAPEVAPESHAYRTYDVPAFMSIPMTLEKLAALLPMDGAPGCPALINCEDEVYTAAALGCTMGVMRHPMVGAMPDGCPDPSFPAVHRNLKTKMDEVTRAVRWHRIAPAFGLNGSQTHIDTALLTDVWQVNRREEEVEAWWGWKSGDTVEKSAPARISRGLPLPEVSPDADGIVPFVVAAKYPDGTVSVATLGRTLHCWMTPRCDVVLQADEAARVGVFGEYRTLTIRSTAVTPGCRIFAQDLMA